MQQVKSQVCHKDEKKQLLENKQKKEHEAKKHQEMQLLASLGYLEEKENTKTDKINLNKD